ncbi:hypothetical protein PSN45_003639 [Yamadazyma tenuis]|uniref:Zn(2)-C6 fungal-type domain-containing protein n=1 Tax=Candida tenuis (strain ATCC 10573 / BCRC 21748 / CBS 615 / JCM 9827 / NBRC 10315 / NRRL Y-1498 / VKM Y-70) TaxID=590646 RepID=G3AZH7_CANTC|nr:uncharacterized protein CANTEDRAFT_91904 [Yamadazyma tenuis ATCC 10573]EGV65581.1 hypothetical protein CANTEDRAFT_91904 [Yamadazyma tenuis ATCC 10573]WEJ96103.1 hypothetical protein PSN45_003639 [Yamadazyma tenuis]
MSLESHACDFCRRRKLKCSRETPRCDKCIWYHKECFYSPENKRVQLTKSNVQKLHTRVSILERLLARYVPNSEELEKLIGATAVAAAPNEAAAANYSPDSIDYVKEEEFLLDEVEDIDDIVWYETDDEKVISEYSGQNVTDGMSALSIESKNLKIPVYYGLASPNGLIRFLQKVDSNTKRNLLENYKPMPASSDYKVTLDIIRHEYGDYYLDNTDFHQMIFECYFTTYHQAYPLIQKSLFLKDYSKLHTKNPMQKKSLTILIYTLLALGSFCKYGDDCVVDLMYYSRVKDTLKQVDIMEYNSFYLLEALTILGNYCQKRNKPNTGWNYHGICFRMAISFGLHREIHVQKEKLDQKALQILERRRRIFWGLYVLDVGHALTLGRPTIAPSLSCININFPSIDFDHPPQTVSEGANPNLIEGFVLEMKLIKISSKIHYVMSSLEKSFMKKTTELFELNREIVKYAQGFPAYFNEDSEIAVPEWFQFRRVKIIWRYKNVQILMFRNYIWQIRPYLQNPKMFTKEVKLIKDCLKVCLDASIETIHSINEYLKHRDLNYFSSWYGIYFVFHAVLVPILLIYNLKDQYSDEEIMKFKYYINLSKDMLFKLKRFNQLTCNLVNLVEILSKGIGEETGPHLKTENDGLVNEIFHKDLTEFRYDFEKSFNDTVLDISPLNFEYYSDLNEQSVNEDLPYPFV